MKKILFIAPNYFQFHLVVYDVIKNHSGYDCQLLEINGKYYYKNFGERVFNFFLKLLTKKNIKIINQSKNLDRTIKYLQLFDVIIINRPDLLSNEQLLTLKSKTKKMCALYWDSMQKIPMQKPTIPYFDICFSFDHQDCLQYKMIKTNNFYFHESKKNDNCQYDVFFLGVYDKRFDDLIKIIRQLKKQNKKVGASLFSYEKHSVPADLQNEIVFMEKIVPFSQAYQFNVNTKIILDLGHQNQSGLSFRPFEALGLNKKLITTNPYVKKYDFYNEKNIFVIENVDHFEVPSSFFDDNYQDIDDDIKKQYSSENWIQTIVKNIEI